MKRIMMMAAIVLLAALAVSCQKEEIGVEDLPTFTAHADNGGMKTDLVGNLIHWNNTDQVKMFGDFGFTIYGVTPRSDDPTWATLTPSENYGITGSMPYRFVHPASMAEGGTENNSTLYVTYPAERNISDEPLKYYPMYGESENHDVAFRNLGGLVKIVLPAIDREVAYIMVSADESITGKYSFASDCSTMSHVGTMADTSITIEVIGNISEGEEVHVSMPNGQYHDFAITIYTTDGYVARKSGSLVNVTQSAITTIAVSNLSFTRLQAPTLRESAFFNSAFLNFEERMPIVFHYNYYESVEGAERIDDGQNGTPIWRKINTNQVDVYTLAAQINAPANCDSMFYCCLATSIDFGDGFNTANVIDMSYMFSHCGNLTSITPTSFNTGNVTDMSWMFDSTPLSSVDLSSFNTANVTDMSGMFNKCRFLRNLDLSSFNTTNVTHMNYMFYMCEKMSSIEFASSARINNTVDIWRMLGYLGTSLTHGCTIHCNESVKWRLNSMNSEYYTGYVHFNTTY